MTQSLADMRRDYARDGLSEELAPLEPFALFHRWFDEAVQTEQLPVEANAMTLATVDAEGQRGDAPRLRARPQGLEEGHAPEHPHQHRAGAELHRRGAHHPGGSGSSCPGRPHPGSPRTALQPQLTTPPRA